MLHASAVGNQKYKMSQEYKQKLLQDIQYFSNRIADARSTDKSNYIYSDENSSDDELTLRDPGPTFKEFRDQHSILKTCLQATQELTSLEVMQFEVNVMVEDPVAIGECTVKEAGVWREVVADCCVDLVPFAITFYTHRAYRRFAPNVFRGLKVTLLKKAHEAELANSVLPGLKRPSDAVEVIKNYAVAQRSRRTTLARLASKFANSLTMEPLPEGGYLLRCTNLLEVSWTLQNKWSPIAPFHQRFRFDLEYMDESYIKIISQAHRQLSDPDVDTDERTFLLSKIISTCLEAQGPTQELHDSLSSDPESAKKLRKRRTTLDREPEAPIIKKPKKDSEVMAPPKSLPKKTKLKGNNSISAKRSADDVVGRAKIPKISEGLEDKDNEINKSDDEGVRDYEKLAVGKSGVVENNNGVASAKNKGRKMVSGEKDNKDDFDKMKSTEKKIIKNKSSVAKSKANLPNNEENVDNTKAAGDKIKSSEKKTGKIKSVDAKRYTNVLNEDKNADKIEVEREKLVSSEKNIRKSKNVAPKNSANVLNKEEIIAGNIIADDDKIKRNEKKIGKTKKVASKSNENMQNDEENAVNVLINSAGRNPNTEKNTNFDIASKRTGHNPITGKMIEKSKITAKDTGKKEDKIATKSIDNRIETVKTLAKTTDAQKSKRNIDSQCIDVENKVVKVASEKCSTKTKNKEKNVIDNGNERKSTKIIDKDNAKTAVDYEKNFAKEKIFNKKTDNAIEKLKSVGKATDIQKFSQDNVEKTAKSKVAKPAAIKNKENNTQKASSDILNTHSSEKEPTRITNEQKGTKVSNNQNKHVENKIINKEDAIVKKKLSANNAAVKENTQNKNNLKNVPLKPANKTKAISKTNLNTGKAEKVPNSGNIEKENSQKEKISKIPQKKSLAMSDGANKKVPLRISPRKPMQKILPKVNVGLKTTSVQKVNTNIPRSAVKPTSKVT